MVGQGMVEVGNLVENLVVMEIQGEYLLTVVVGVRWGMVVLVGPWVEFALEGLLALMELVLVVIAVLS